MFSVEIIYLYLSSNKSTEGPHKTNMDKSLGTEFFDAIFTEIEATDVNEKKFNI